MKFTRLAKAQLSGLITPDYTVRTGILPDLFSIGELRAECAKFRFEMIPKGLGNHCLLCYSSQSTE